MSADVLHHEIDEEEAAARPPGPARDLRNVIAAVLLGGLSGSVLVATEKLARAIEAFATGAVLPPAARPMRLGVAFYELLMVARKVRDESGGRIEPEDLRLGLERTLQAVEDAQADALRSVIAAAAPPSTPDQQLAAVRPDLGGAL